jgi:hypothetical protein
MSEAELIQAGWRRFRDPYGYQRESPYQHRWVWLTRPEWPEPQKANPQELHPALNVEGLWFLPAESGTVH